MLSNRCAKKFIKSDWRFVGQLPKQYDRNLFLITPYSRKEDLCKYLAISAITKFSHTLYIKRKIWFLVSLIFLRKNKIRIKPSKDQIDTIFNTKKEGQRQINVVLQLTHHQKLLQPEDLMFYQYASLNKIPITLIAIDRVSKMVKFHTLFFASKDINRDIRFMERYFDSHHKKNQKLIR